jgi:predicted NBD/HSP70 family sugar kinase
MYLVFDIGGTTTRFATSDDLQKIRDFESFQTIPDYKESTSKISQVITHLIRDKKIEGVAGGITGVLNKNRDSLVRSPHLKNWENKPFKKFLEEQTNSEVFLENDTAMCGLGEYSYEPRKKYKVFSYITVSTGVGGVRIDEGMIDHKTFGFEPGFQIVGRDSKGLIYLEDKISGSGIQENYGVAPSTIQNEEFWEEISEWLAIGLNNTIVHWSPEIIVLGGSLIYRNIIPLDSTIRHLKNSMKIFTEIPSIEKAVYDDKSGVYGAMYFLSSKS